MSIWRAACERAGRTSARPGRNALWWREFGSRYNAQEIIRRMLGRASGVAGFPPNRQTPSALCVALQSSRTHTPSALCAALQSYRSSRYLQSYRSHALMSRSLRVPPQQLQGFQVRILQHSGTVALIFEPSFSAQLGEVYAPHKLYCGYCNEFHDRSSFSSQQCGCARESRFCLLFSHVAQSLMPRHHAQPSKGACFWLWHNGLSQLGRNVLAASNGDGQQARRAALAPPSLRPNPSLHPNPS